MYDFHRDISIWINYSKTACSIIDLGNTMFPFITNTIHISCWYCEFGTSSSLIFRMPSSYNKFLWKNNEIINAKQVERYEVFFANSTENVKELQEQKFVKSSKNYSLFILNWNTCIYQECSRIVKFLQM